MHFVVGEVLDVVTVCRDSEIDVLSTRRSLDMIVVPLSSHTLFYASPSLLARCKDVEYQQNQGKHSSNLQVSRPRAIGAPGRFRMSIGKRWWTVKARPSLGFLEHVFIIRVSEGKFSLRS